MCETNTNRHKWKKDKNMETVGDQHPIHINGQIFQTKSVRHTYPNDNKTHLMDIYDITFQKKHRIQILFSSAYGTFSRLTT